MKNYGLIRLGYKAMSSVYSFLNSNCEPSYMTSAKRVFISSYDTANTLTYFVEPLLYYTLEG